jgi:hypothetical protein
VAGHEIDCLIEKAYDKLVPIEIKSSMTISDRFFKNIIDWKTIVNHPTLQGYLVYNGHENWLRKEGKIFSWSDNFEMLAEIYE